MRDDTHRLLSRDRDREDKQEWDIMGTALTGCRQRVVSI
jgi:hypothetical protein